jgi:hypothetical protein
MAHTISQSEAQVEVHRCFDGADEVRRRFGLADLARACLGNAPRSCRSFMTRLSSFETAVLQVRVAKDARNLNKRGTMLGSYFEASRDERFGVHWYHPGLP